MALKERSLKADVKATTPYEEVTALLAKLDEVELGKLRHAIDERLQVDLGSLNLQDELGLQYRQGKNLLTTITNDPDIPANQKSSVFNMVRNQLAEIVANQNAVWGMERLKKFEVAFIKASTTLTLEARQAFYDLYCEYLKDDSAPR